MDGYQEIKEAVIEGKVTEISKLITGVLEKGAQPLDIIEQGLIAEMKVVGALLKNGDMYTPEVLASAKTMHAGMEILRPCYQKGRQDRWAQSSWERSREISMYREKPGGNDV